VPRALAEMAPAAKLRSVTIWIDPKHPLLQLKESLDWSAIHQIVKQHLRLAGCNVDGILRGRTLRLHLYVPMIILMLVMRKNSRQMEETMSFHAVARDFLALPDSRKIQVRDHSTIARVLDKLGAEGLAAIGSHIAADAIRFGFEDPSVLSADTTAQQLSIGYPNEPGILQGIAQRCLRACNRLKKAGRKKLQDVRDQAIGVLKKVKEHHLFAKAPEAKEALLRATVRQTKRLLVACGDVQDRLYQADDTLSMGALKTFASMREVGSKLLPQIISWMNTGKVAPNKILHAGLPMARAIVRNKAGKKCEFGLRHLIMSLTNGYLMSQQIGARMSEFDMPALALSFYQQIIGVNTAPELFVYDRGAWSQKNVTMLKAAGVEKIGIQPKGKSRSRLSAQDKTRVLQHRSRIEGKIGTLKADYAMDRPRERLGRTVAATTPRSVASFNLNKMMTDLATKSAATAA
jgi:hypothetical protein